jgi:hypothetical protein
MRKSYSELSAKRRSKVNKNVEAYVRNYWNQVAPNQSDDELQKLAPNNSATIMKDKRIRATC